MLSSLFHHFPPDKGTGGGNSVEIDQNEGVLFSFFLFASLHFIILSILMFTFLVFRDGFPLFCTFCFLLVLRSLGCPFVFGIASHFSYSFPFRDSFLCLFACLSIGMAFHTCISSFFFLSFFLFVWWHFICFILVFVWSWPPHWGQYCFKYGTYLSISCFFV